MNSNSQSANSPDTYSHRWADIVGTAIALLTLTLPVFIIAHYSSQNAQENPSSLSYHLSKSQV
ncbi:hypothetical protein B6N60_03286 [Richelia sinica FACHB-800]|uniref:Uncharacterized protein n=1 Tax=Richelia sinica FACHB-800 TaxID=1357546 RepID=A0A975TAW7_9NOST|nr:hypothetical protein [Richelia sinica]MBD2663402.1 hypothetical protein [Richelia sinica FACHB-800]QXE24581.1 hypothetical protein B6N60_03286 [Richelia sinica FACHB-800]